MSNTHTNVLTSAFLVWAVNFSKASQNCKTWFALPFPPKESLEISIQDHQSQKLLCLILSAPEISLLSLSYCIFCNHKFKCLVFNWKISAYICWHAFLSTDRVKMLHLSKDLGLTCGSFGRRSSNDIIQIRLFSNQNTFRP